jgi:hypothetical protein
MFLIRVNFVANIKPPPGSVTDGGLMRIEGVAGLNCHAEGKRSSAAKKSKRLRLAAASPSNGHQTGVAYCVTNSMRIAMRKLLSFLIALALLAVQPHPSEGM